MFAGDGGFAELVFVLVTNAFSIYSAFNEVPYEVNSQIGITCLETLDSSSKYFSSGGTNVRKPALTLKETHKPYDLF